MPPLPAEEIMQVAIYYGSSSGNTERIATRLAALLADHRPVLHDVAQTSLADAEHHDLLFFGIPTWNEGECQPDWAKRWPELECLDLSRAHVALFAPGDQLGYPTTYCNAMGKLHALLASRDVRCIGGWPKAGYRGGSPLALTNDGSQFVGLPLDEESQGNLTPVRLRTWAARVLAEYEEIRGGVQQ